MKKLVLAFAFLFISAVVYPVAASDAESPDGDSGAWGWYKMGTYEYASWGRPSVEHHLGVIDRDLDHENSRFLARCQLLRESLEDLKKLPSGEAEHCALKEEIVHDYGELFRLTGCYYRHGVRNIYEYVDGRQMPKALAWRFGILLGIAGFAQSELGRMQADAAADERQVLSLYQASLVYLSYALGMIQETPSFLDHEYLKDLLADPGYCTDIESSFREAFASLDAKAWDQALQGIDYHFYHREKENWEYERRQARIESVCEVLRKIYGYFLEQRERLPDAYVPIAAHLCASTTKLILSIQREIYFNLDAAHGWLFKVCADLNAWEAAYGERLALVAPQLASLQPAVQHSCAQWLPEMFSLQDVTAENEYEVCALVRQRNLFPSNQGKEESGAHIIDEFEFTTTAIKRFFVNILFFFDARARFAKYHDTSMIVTNWYAEHVYNYLSGYIDLEDIGIDRENALDYLLVIKIVDRIIQLWNTNGPVEFSYSGFHFGARPFDQFYFPRSTYELRKHILKLCPHLHSYEALTHTLNSERIREEGNAATEGAWVEEAAKLRDECVAALQKDARRLSEKMACSPLAGIVVGARGVSAAGKSTFLKNVIFPMIDPSGDAEDLAKGILNPDTIKAVLKKLQGDTLNNQVHAEAAGAFRQLLRDIASEGEYILDQRQLTPHSISTTLIEPAKQAGRLVWLFDFDVPLTTSMLRILGRPLHGEDPCPNYELLVNGVLSARRYRSQVIALALREDSVAKYELYATSRQVLAAHKDASGLCIDEPGLYAECLRVPTYGELEDEASQIIDDDLIDLAIARGDVAAEQRAMLQQWCGLSLKEAVQWHVLGSKDVTGESLFEMPHIEAFNGEEWLADLPQLIDYLEAEHRLHLSGVDDTGRGLHWEQEQVDTGGNPTYSPQAQAADNPHCGIQMRLGYFVVPMKNLETHLSEKISPEVVRELTIRNDSNELVGLRFFVHPEACGHYAPLLQAGIPFVPPSQSEFVATPTASYDAWLVRRVSMPGRRPFIVKMGVPNGNTDIKRLLPADDVARCLARQKCLDKLPERTDFLLFKDAAGLILKNIDGYPAGMMDSGIIVCELPEEFIQGDCKLISIASLMSCERVRTENRGSVSLDGASEELKKLPLVFQLMDTAVQHGLVDTPMEFIRRYFIEGYLQAIEPLVFEEGLSLAAAPDHLYVVLNKDNTIRGFAYRDLKGVGPKSNYLQSYSWYYRYASMIKLLNVLTRNEESDIPPLPGAPIQAGTEQPVHERNLYSYLQEQLLAEEDPAAVSRLASLSLAREESMALLMQLDAAYIDLLTRYFDIEVTDFLTAERTVPAAEPGSMAEKRVKEYNEALWERRQPS